MKTFSTYNFTTTNRVAQTHTHKYMRPPHLCDEQRVFSRKSGKMVLKGNTEYHHCLHRHHYQKEMFMRLFYAGHFCPIFITFLKFEIYKVSLLFCWHSGALLLNENHIGSNVQWIFLGIFKKRKEMQ